MASLLVGVTTGLRLGLRGGGLARKEGRKEGWMDGGEKVKSSLMFAWGRGISCDGGIGAGIVMGL